MTVHPIYRVCSFQFVAPYTLRVQFDDHTEQVIDFEPVLAGELYRPLRDFALFNSTVFVVFVALIVLAASACVDASGKVAPPRCGASADSSGGEYVPDDHIPTGCAAVRRSSLAPGAPSARVVFFPRMVSVVRNHVASSANV